MDFYEATTVVLLLLVGEQLFQKSFQCNSFFFGQCCKHGFIAAVEEPVTAFCHQISQTASVKLGSVMLAVFVTAVFRGIPLHPVSQQLFKQRTELFLFFDRQRLERVGNFFLWRAAI